MVQHWTINGTLLVSPALERLDAVAEPVAAALESMPDATGVGLAEIDAAMADTATFCDNYEVPTAASANCVVVAGKRGGDVRYVACLALATTRVNVNTVVRKRLDVRKASFANLDTTVELTGMEYGGVTPIGLPGDWTLLVDAEVAAAPELVIGGGVRGSKLLVSGGLLANLPGAEVVDDLACPV